MTSRLPLFFWIAVWLAAIALAATLDATVALHMRHWGLEEFFKSHKIVAELLKSPGEFYFTAIVVVAVARTHPFGWRGGGFVLLATSVSAANWVIKWAVGRFRPFKAGGGDLPHPFELEPLAGGWLGGYYTRNLCFPSGHAALAFATAAAVAMLWPNARWRGWCFVVATVVAIQRIGENAHWLSDVVAGTALGIGGVHVIRWIVTRWVDVEAMTRGAETEASQQMA